MRALFIVILALLPLTAQAQSVGPNYFRGDDAPRGADGRRLAPSPDLLEHRRRYDTGERRVPQISRGGALTTPAWMESARRAKLNASPARSGDVQSCIAIINLMERCTMAQVDQTGSIVDIACFGREMDNRDHEPGLAALRGSQHLDGYLQMCGGWQALNQSAPLRR